MTYRILLHPKAFLNSCDPTIENRIKNNIKELKTLPEKRGTHLTHSSFWKQRAGDYRVIYEIDHEADRILVLFIGHRTHVYDDFSKLL